MTLTEQILELIRMEPGLTDREITNALRGASNPQQPINQAARRLESNGFLVRRKRSDGLIGNFPPGVEPPAKPELMPEPPASIDGLSEDELKRNLIDWLSGQGWESVVAWGRERGIDIDAWRAEERWVIEVKGVGSRPQMRVNYFLSILGETLQRMDDPGAKYSIALPDVKQFRNLWDRLPKMAKERTGISVLFVMADGQVAELH